MITAQLKEPEKITARVNPVVVQSGGGGGITRETDPTVPDWAKQPNKPTYSAEEVGAIPAAELPAAITAALAQAKESGEFDGTDGSRGTGILKVKSSTLSASGTGENGAAIKYKMDLSTVTSESGVAEVLVGDVVLRSYYTYQVVAVDSAYVYFGEYSSIRGAQGSPGDDYVLTNADKAEIAGMAAELIDAELLPIIGSGVTA